MKKCLKTFIYKKPDRINPVDEIRQTLIEETDIENESGSSNLKSLDDEVSTQKSNTFRNFRKRLSLRRRRNSQSAPNLNEDLIKKEPKRKRANSIYTTLSQQEIF